MTCSIQHYQEVIEGLLDENIGISKYFSYIVIKSPVIKDGPCYIDCYVTDATLITLIFLLMSLTT